MALQEHQKTQKLIFVKFQQKRNLPKNLSAFSINYGNKIKLDSNFYLVLALS